MESHFYSGKLLDELAAIGFETDRDEEWIAVIVSTFHEIRDEIHHVTKMDLDVATTKLLLAFRKVDTRLERTYEKNMCITIRSALRAKANTIMAEHKVAGERPETDSKGFISKFTGGSLHNKKW